MLTAMILDIEESALSNVESMIKKHFDIKIVGTYIETLNALENIKKGKPDVVFLSFKLPEIKGFDIAKEIFKVSSDTSLVFITNDSNYAMDAFEIGAIDYMVAPISEERMSLCFAKLLRNAKEKDKNSLDSMYHLFRNHIQSNRVAVWKDEYIILLNIEEILYCTINSNKESLLITKNDQFKSNRNLSELEQELAPYNFFRCHRSFLVNLNFIEKIAPWFNRTYILYLKNLTASIPVSRNYIKNFKKILKIQ